MNELVSELPVPAVRAAAASARRGVTTEPGWVQALLVLGALGFLLSFLLLPLLLVFAEALRGGVQALWSAVSDADALSAVRLTLLVAAIVIPLNLVFGVAAAWVVSKHRFPGKRWLVTLIDLPFSVSPVVAGHIRGRTNTLPLHVEILYNEYAYSAAFACASLLAGTALLTLVLKTFLEWRHGQSLAAAHRSR